MAVRIEIFDDHGVSASLIFEAMPRAGEKMIWENGGVTRTMTVLQVFHYPKGEGIEARVQVRRD